MPLRMPRLDPNDWRRSSLCAGEPGGVFFITRGQSSKPGKFVCALCDVQPECLDHALGEEDTTIAEYGIFGGTTPRERRRLRKGELTKLEIRQRLDDILANMGPT